jgi:hypothetical protein
MTQKSQVPRNVLDRLLAFLRHLGWSKALEREAHPLRSRRASSPAPGWWVVEGHKEEAVLLALAAPSEKGLTSPSRLYTQFEDLGSEVRELLDWWRDNPPVPDYLVLADEKHTLLLDVANEQYLAACEEAEDISELVLPHLNYRDVVRGSLANAPRRSTEEWGKELAGWVNHWTATIGAATGLERSRAREFVLALLLARQAEALGFAPGRQRLCDGAAAGRGKSGARSKSVSRAGASGGGASCPAALKRIWSALDMAGYLEAPMGQKALVGIVETLLPPELPHRWLASLNRLSGRRLRAEVLAVAVADEELRRVSWGAMVIDALAPPPGLEKDDDLSAWLRTVWDIPLDQLGYGPMLRAFTMVVEKLEEYSQRQRALAMRGKCTHLQLDLFTGELEGLTKTLGVEDPVAYALEHVLRIRTSVASRVRMTRLVLISRALEFHASKAPLLPPLPPLPATVPEEHSLP